MSACAPKTEAVADEIQTLVGAAEEASLTGTIATRRLAELNALVEDPKLWNDPRRAQALMRERTRLDRGVTAIARSSASSTTRSA